MHTVYRDADLPIFLDQSALELLRDGRKAYQENGLDTFCFHQAPNDTHIFTWRGIAINNVLAIGLTGAGLRCAIHDIGITVSDIDTETTMRIVRQIADAPPDADDLSPFVENLRNAKYDELVPEQVLRTLWAKANTPYVIQLGDLARKLNL